MDPNAAAAGTPARTKKKLVKRLKKRVKGGAASGSSVMGVGVHPEEGMFRSKKRPRSAGEISAPAAVTTADKKKKKKTKKKNPKMPKVADAGNYCTRHHIRIVRAEDPDCTATAAYKPPEPFDAFQRSPFFADFQSDWELAKLQDPTPIQAAGWPIILEGHDVVVCAKTGSGKTFGYLLPMFARLLRERSKGSTVSDKTEANWQPSPSCVVLAPTRELALQIQHEALRFGKTKAIRSVCVFGGPPKHTQVNSLKGGANAFPHLVIATPGRLADFAGTGVINLSKVAFLVVDEADRMYTHACHLLSPCPVLPPTFPIYPFLYYIAPLSFPLSPFLSPQVRHGIFKAAGTNCELFRKGRRHGSPELVLFSHMAEARGGSGGDILEPKASSHLRWGVV
jgi:hypothetical protein